MFCNKIVFIFVSSQLVNSTLGTQKVNNIEKCWKLWFIFLFKSLLVFWSSKRKDSCKNRTPDKSSNSKLFYASAFACSNSTSCLGLEKPVDLSGCKSRILLNNKWWRVTINKSFIGKNWLFPWWGLVQFCFSAIVWLSRSIAEGDQIAVRGVLRTFPREWNINNEPQK